MDSHLDGKRANLHLPWQKEGEIEMFDNFTEKAIKVIMLAAEESRRMGHNYIGTEQILIAAVWEEGSVATKVLRSLGFSLGDIRSEVEKITGRGSGYVAKEIPLTPRAKQAISDARAAARQLGQDYIGTKHLLLGLIDNPENIAYKVLTNLKIDPNQVRDLTMRMMGENTTPASERSASSQSQPNEFLEFQLNVNSRLERAEKIIVMLQRKLSILDDDLSADNSP